MDLLEVIDYIIEIISNLVSNLETATEYIDSVEFDTLPLVSEANTIFGHIHWLLGTPTYIVFYSLMGVGISILIWQFTIKMIAYIREAFFV